MSITVLKILILSLLNYSVYADTVYADIVPSAPLPAEKCRQLLYASSPKLSENYGITFGSDKGPVLTVLLANAINIDLFTRNELLTNSQKTKIAIKFADSQSLGESTAFRASFDVFKDLRLTPLLDIVARHFKKVLANVSYHVDTRAGGYAVGWPPKDAQIKIHVPDLTDGALIAFLQTHEFEHVLQKAVSLGSSVQHIERINNSVDEYVGLIFYFMAVEKSALVSEWNFLNAIPEQAKLKVVERWKTAAILAPEDVINYSRIFLNSSLPLSEYIRLELESGRYNLQSSLVTVTRLIKYIFYAVNKTEIGIYEIQTYGQDGNINFPPGFLAKPSDKEWNRLSAKINAIRLLTASEKTDFVNYLQTLWR